MRNTLNQQGRELYLPDHLVRLKPKMTVRKKMSSTKYEAQVAALENDEDSKQRQMRTVVLGQTFFAFSFAALHRGSLKIQPPFASSCS